MSIEIIVDIGTVHLRRFTEQGKHVETFTMSKEEVEGLIRTIYQQRTNDLVRLMDDMNMYELQMKNRGE